MNEDSAKVLDLSTRTFEEFVAFFFDRDVVPDDEQFNLFLTDLLGNSYDESAMSAPEVVVGHMTRLFSEFDRIATKYSQAQLNQGIWGLLGVNLRLSDALWDSSVPLEQRLECIRSMYVVYADFVAKLDVAQLETCFYMWWDLLLDGFWWQQSFYELQIERGDVSKLDPESRRSLEVLLETLKRILDLSDRRTQKCALHGLGHLNHPAVRQTVQAYIDAHKGDFTEEGLRWVEQCRDGTVM